MMRRKKECEDGCGKCYFCRHPLFLSSFTQHKLSFTDWLTSVGKGLIYPNLCRSPSSPSPIITVNLYSAKPFGPCPPVIIYPLQLVQQPSSQTYVFPVLISWMLFIDSEIHKYNYLPILQSVREITGRNVPVWNWWTSGIYLPLHLFGPEKYGGLGDVANKARDVVAATGQDVEDVTKEVDPYFQYHYRCWRLIIN